MFREANEFPLFKNHSINSTVYREDRGWVEVARSILESREIYEHQAMMEQFEELDEIAYTGLPT